jgi:hypothetical protein
MNNNAPTVRTAARTHEIIRVEFAPTRRKTIPIRALPVQTGRQCDEVFQDAGFRIKRHVFDPRTGFLR